MAENPIREKTAEIRELPESAYSTFEDGSTILYKYEKFIIYISFYANRFICFCKYRRGKT